jgi:ubiquinone/menaquinone biosynthesis C-methylase UbiE
LFATFFRRLGAIVSSYENYSATSGNYDETRAPVGVEVIAQCLATSPITLADQVLVDAGCGTGNYSQALIERLGRIIAIDLNDGMLATARSKLATEESAGRVEFHLAMIDALPIAARSVHGVMVNQVLHHLEDDPDRGYPAHRSVLEEFARVLKPGGSLVINTCSHDQLTDGFWYYAFFADIAAAMADRHIPCDTLDRLLRDAGFEQPAHIARQDLVIQGPAYFEPKGIFDQAWRHGDSIWSMLSRERLEEVLEQARRLDAEGGLEEFFRLHDAKRQRIGQFTFVHARRAG